MVVRDTHARFVRLLASGVGVRGAASLGFRASAQSFSRRRVAWTLGGFPTANCCFIDGRAPVRVVQFGTLAAPAAPVLARAWRVRAAGRGFCVAAKTKSE